jgi:hypothetical protein
MSQSRGGYISPDPSPIAEAPFITPDLPGRGYALHQADFFGTHAAHHSQSDHAGRSQHEATGFLRRHSDAPHFHQQQYPEHYQEQMRAAVMGFKNGHIQEIDPFYYPIMPQRPTSMGGNQTKRGKGRRVDGKQPTFLTKLYQ